MNTIKAFFFTLLFLSNNPSSTSLYAWFYSASRKEEQTANFQAMDLTTVRLLHVGSHIKVVIKQGEKEGIAIVGTDKMKKDLSITLQNGELVCMQKKENRDAINFKQGHSDIILYIYVTSPLKLYKLSLSGAAQVEINPKAVTFAETIQIDLKGASLLGIADKITTTSLNINLSGSAQITSSLIFQVEENLDIILSGDSSIHNINGTCQYADIALKGSSSIEHMHIIKKAKSVDAIISGNSYLDLKITSHHVYVMVKGTSTAKIAGQADEAHIISKPFSKLSNQLQLTK